MTATQITVIGRPSAVAANVAILRRTDSGYIGFARAEDAVGHPTTTPVVLDKDKQP